MSLKLSDKTFIQESIERADAPLELPPRLASEDLTSLRGIGDKRTRTDASIFNALSDYEPVSFLDPHGIRRYGYLIGVEPSGEARIEIGDGEYAILPRDEVRRIGAKEDREKVAEQLRAALQSEGFGRSGIRKDMRVSGEPVPLGPDSEGNYALSVQYATASGVPSEHDVRTFIASEYENADVTEFDTSVPGRVGIAVHVAEAKEADIPEAVAGGEVLETLDPDTDVKNSHSKSGQVMTNFVQSIRGKNGPSNPQVPPSEMARVLIKGNQEPLIQKIYQRYVGSPDGALALARTKEEFNPMVLLQVALGWVAKNDANLWKDASDEFMVLSGNNTAYPQSSQKLGPMSPQTPAQQSFDFNAPPAGGETTQNPTAGKTATKTAATAKDYNMAPAMGEAMRGMRVTTMSRRGTYIVATVKWDPKKFDTSSNGAVSHMVITFMKGKTATSDGPFGDLGFVGKMHVDSIDVAKGVAKVRFQSLASGNAPTEVVHASEDVE